jgi:hypothetical protein
MSGDKRPSKEPRRQNEIRRAAAPLFTPSFRFLVNDVVAILILPGFEFSK